MSQDALAIVQSPMNPRTHRATTLDVATPHYLDQRLAQSLRRLDAGDGRLERALLTDQDGLLMATTDACASDVESAALAALVASFIPRFAAVHGPVQVLSLGLAHGRVLEVRPLGARGAQIVSIASAPLDAQRAERIAREIRLTLDAS